MKAKLDFEGKLSLDEIYAQHHNGQLEGAPENILDKGRAYFMGDNLPILLHLLPQLKGKIDLIYIDPPFGTGQPFVDIHQEQAYSDQLEGDAFLAFLWKRLIVLREFLSEQGSIYVHIDKKVGHYVRVMLDEIFGPTNHINDLTRIKCNPKNFSRKAYGNFSDMILFYAKNRDQHIWNDLTEPLREEEVQQLFPRIHPTHGPYTTHPLHAPGETRSGDTGQEWKGLMPPPGRHWRFSREELDRLEAAGRIEWSSTGNPRKIVFAKDHKGKKIQDVWTFKDKGLSYVDYPTQKNHDLLQRIILNSSHENSWIMDAFAGSGGTLWVAESLKRKWIGMDQSPMAINLANKQIEKLQLEVESRTWNPS
ncbi:MAG: site-specific DNA-methyltransferase [Bacteroidota bacterium]